MADTIMQIEYTDILWVAPQGVSYNIGREHNAQTYFLWLTNSGPAPKRPDKAGKRRDFQRLYYSYTNHLFQ